MTRNQSRRFQSEKRRRDTRDCRVHRVEQGGAKISIVRVKREARPMVREMARSKLHGNRDTCNPRFARSVTRRVRVFPRKEEILFLMRITLPGKENFKSFSTRGNSDVKSFAPGTQVADSSTKLRSSPTKEGIFSRQTSLRSIGRACS